VRRIRQTIMEHPILSYPILSYPILSYPILSYNYKNNRGVEVGLRAGEIVHYKGFEIAVNYDFIYKSTIAVNLDIIT